MNIVRLTESLKVQSLPALGVSLTIRGGEAWTRAKLATKGMAHFIFGRGGKGISLLSKRSGGMGGRGGERVGRRFCIKFGLVVYICSGVSERDQIR